MKKVAPHGVVTRGLDVSHYDGTVYFAKVKAAGYEFCFAKCTEYNADTTYASNKAKAKGAGLLFGAYHFFHPSRDPKAQAEKFLSSADLKAGDLHPVLDWESNDDVPSAQDRERALVWLNHVEAACGKAPIIYGAPYFLQALGLGEEFRKYPLWIAHYGTQAPLVPAPWDTWSFWQHSEKGDVPGIAAPDEDLDLFNGPLDNLMKLTL